MNDIEQWEPPKGTWHITFTMWNGPYTVADEYVIPVPDNTLYSDQAYEVAKKIFPLGEFAYLFTSRIKKSLLFYLIFAFGLK